MNRQKGGGRFWLEGDSCAVISGSLEKLELEDCGLESVEYLEYLNNL